ncbi:hypothetical protein JCGZ_25383 [Jatropha curcas]|uniref:J domain-containing protein n=1 Tax=Jatropha curcas TaxID=180498 RepID=A0A067JVH5_JATCU|nr:uncharacterized protein LOC105647119 [Jatropha curcas]XP_012088503.1 uncharacterized protein LOC105647119 [Jatropha curcas]XP_012088504.1 uncharacterized protein LOC105647119 [Jatropha curcas]KDP23995.1 hypothetical protein JCGZ_25383 [Jatropha curcas]
MECNKEEAARAKGIAEQKMRNNDFVGAHKIALRAQHLYKDLDNISQMLMVCAVHCAADKKLFGNEMDWYGILQIEPTADEATIKKQYRKFALLLHPDKNKFPGAEAAFKLIGEAQRVLSDKGNRSLYDIKRKVSISKSAAPYMPHQRATYSSKIGVQNNYRSNFVGFNLQQEHTQQSIHQQGSINGHATFQTACPFCDVKYQYHVNLLYRYLLCQNCSKHFIARHCLAQGAPTGTNSNQSAIPPRKDVPNHGSIKELDRQNNSSSEQSKTESFQKKGCDPKLASQKANGKRRRKKDSDSSIYSENVVVDEAGDFEEGLNSRCFDEYRRRSDRHKQKVSCKENLSDDEDFVTHPKRAKGSGSSCATEEEYRNGLKDDFLKATKYSGLASCEKGHNGEKQKAGPKSSLEENHHERSNEVHIHSASDSSSKSVSDPELHECPDPDFNDFDKGRNEGCFSVGQIWAVYDTLDAMPRFCALIRKVFSPKFKLRVTWLESNPDDEDGIEWVNEGLPTSCGNFRHGDSENTENCLMFSHVISWEKGSQRNTYKIFPRKGEIWAVFKNWDIKWKSDVDTNRKFEYEFVEILSEYTEDVGASVAYLGKVKGYVSLFCRISKEGKDKFQIPPGELFRFSHMIPSFKLTGEERQGVPRGSFELDPASLPKNIEEVALAEDIVVDVGKAYAVSTGSKSSDKVKSNVESEGSTAAQQADLQGADLEPEVTYEECSAPPTSTPEDIEIPEPEFFNFDAEKSIEKFQVGQIWSLYSDEDGLPKYYGQITKIGTGQGFKLWLRWLIPCALPNDVIQWRDEDMPICCGRFSTRKGGLQSYSSTDAFSHQLSAEPVGKKNEYTILPRKGQVWALYRNWSAQINHYELNECKYDAVEVQEENDLVIKVSLLEKVEGFNSVFKARLNEGLAVIMEVHCVELLRFSHQIPAFRLTEERGGSLRGFWELDPAALPVHL